MLELELSELGPPEDIVPILAHCVARAYRVRRELDVAPSAGPYRRPERRSAPDNESLEAQLATVASVYLGFGILAANGAHRYRAAGQQIGSSTRTEWIHDSVGGLDATAVSYLLALQLVVRGVDDAYAAGVVSALAANQASDVREWMTALRPDAAALRTRLGVPKAPRDWPTEWEPDLEPIDDGDESGDDVERPEALRVRDATKRNQGRPVWRVRRSRAVQGGTIGGLAGAALLAVLGSVADVPGSLLLLLVFCCVAGGTWLGRRMRNDFCSDPRCEAPLDPSHRECPRCGGHVAGEIARQSQRLAAEEDLEERERAERQGASDEDA